MNILDGTSLNLMFENKIKDFGIWSLESDPNILNSLRFEHFGKYSESNTCNMVDSIPI